MRPLALTLLLLTTGCLQSARSAQLVQTHYVGRPLAQQTRRSALARLELLRISHGVCFSVSEPCLLTPGLREHPGDGAVCLQWGDTTECFDLVEPEPGSPVVITPRAPSPTSTITPWLYAQLDPDYPEVARAADAQAEREALELERAPVERASSVWGNVRLAFAVPQVEAGLHAQGGYRRWLSPSVLVSLGGGYEGVLLQRAGEALRSAVLLTARLELSSATFKTTFLNVPAITGYFGLTSAVVVSPGGGVGLRGFVGVSCIVPVSIELGVSVLSAPGLSPQPAFFVAAGVGL